MMKKTKQLLLTFVPLGVKGDIWSQKSMQKIKPGSWL